MPVTLLKQTVDIHTLYITLDDFPRTRKRDTNQIIASREALVAMIQGKGIPMRPMAIKGVLAGSGFEKGKGYGAGLLISPIGAQNLMDFVNQVIQETWDNA